MFRVVLYLAITINIPGKGALRILENSSLVKVQKMIRNPRDGIATQPGSRSGALLADEVECLIINIATV